MRAVGIIPARFASTRFPGKPLAQIAGRSMIERVWRGASGSKHLGEVIVATDDERIEAACAAFGARVVRTSPDHPSGTDRIAEAARHVEADIVVNVQGDEPLIEGSVVDAAVECLLGDSEAPMATLVHRAGPAAHRDPNRVKVVVDQRGHALYFSRAPIPAIRDSRDGSQGASQRDSRDGSQADRQTGPRAAAKVAVDPGSDAEAITIWQHIGIYAYRREFLAEFVRLPQTPAERSEALEQLRALEHGHPIRVGVVERFEGVAVDEPEHVARVEARLRELGRA